MNLLEIGDIYNKITMRKIDKKLNLTKINQLAENRYLEAKGFGRENKGPFYHVLEYGDYGSIGHQGCFSTQEEAKQEVARLSNYFPKSSFEIFVSDSEQEPPITTSESKFNESEENISEDDRMGISLRSLLDGELAMAARSADLSNYNERNDFISKIEDRLMDTDWISMSNGTTFNKSFTPSQK